MSCVCNILRISDLWPLLTSSGEPFILQSSFKLRLFLCKTKEVEEATATSLSPSPQKSEKEQLLQEQTQLEQNLEEMHQNLCGLCKSVESGSDQDHLQLLAKLSSPDFTIPSPSPLVKDEESHITIEMVSCSAECDPEATPTGPAQGTSPEVGAHAEEAGSPQSGPAPASFLNACLDMNSSL